MSTELATTVKPSLLAKFGERYEIEPAKVLSILANTAFKQSGNEPALSNDEVAAAMIVCNQFDLNPFLKEIYAFRSKGKLLIVVSVDGWCKIINERKQLNGMEFEEHFDETGKIYSVTCKLHRSDRTMPTVVTEYIDECKRPTDPWTKSPIRMLRHRALMQCARYAFSISGIVDEEEAALIDPTFNPSIPIIDQQDHTEQTPEQKEAEKLMESLKWNAGKKSQFRGRYKENIKAGLDYLREESKKVARTKPGPVQQQQAQAEPERQPEAVPEEDMQGEYVETNTGEYTEVDHGQKLDGAFNF